MFTDELLFSFKASTSRLHILRRYLLNPKQNTSGCTFSGVWISCVKVSLRDIPYRLKTWCGFEVFKKSFKSFHMCGFEVPKRKLKKKFFHHFGGFSFRLVAFGARSEMPLVSEPGGLGMAGGWASKAWSWLVRYIGVGSLWGF